MSNPINARQQPTISSVPFSEFWFRPVAERDRSRSYVVVRKSMATEYDRGWRLPIRQRGCFECMLISAGVAI